MSTNLPENMRCYLVTKTGKDQVQAHTEQRPLRELPPGDVLIRVAWSSLNYKDALATKGHPGVVRRFPHVPGIDAAGIVVASDVPAFRTGQRVLVTSYELGAGQWGGWAEYVRVPAAWVVPLPEQLSLREAMVYGTAGLTAAMSVDALVQHGIAPPDDVVVTGASGSVGCIALQVLAGLGFRVAAVSGKAERYAWLRSLGAAEILSREEVHDASDKPLLAARWAGAVDTVGGNMLATLLRAARPHACITACGLVGGTDLPLSIYPFILRGVTLCGIDSAHAPYDLRVKLWNRLAATWRAPLVERDARDVELQHIDTAVDEMLAGRHAGRDVVKLSGER